METVTNEGNRKGADSIPNQPIGNVQNVSNGPDIHPGQDTSSAPSGGTCEVCGKPSELSCSKCCRAYYCSRDHQRQAWKEHKQECYPAVRRAPPPPEVNEPSDLTVTRDIPQGEVFLKESPILVYPFSKDPDELICVECCNPIEDLDKIVFCSECGWELCSEACRSKTDGHHRKNECPVFKMARCVDLQDFNGKGIDWYLAIGLIRTLLLRDRKPHLWALIQDMDRCKKPTSKTSLIELVKLLLHVSAFIPANYDYEFETVAHALDVLETNSIDISDHYSTLTGLVPSQEKCVSALFPLNVYTTGGRSCISNAHYSIKATEAGDFQLRMIANVPIPKGSCLSLSMEQYDTSGTVTRKLSKSSGRKRIRGKIGSGEKSILMIKWS